MYTNNPEFSFCSTVTEIFVPDLEQYDTVMAIPAIVDRCYDLGVQNQILMCDNLELPTVTNLLEQYEVIFELERL